MTQILSAGYVSESSEGVEGNALVIQEEQGVKVDIPLSGESVKGLFVNNVNYFLQHSTTELSEDEKMYIQGLLADNPAEAQRELLSLYEIKRHELGMLGNTSYYDIYVSMQDKGTPIAMIDQATEFINNGKIEGRVLLAGQDIQNTLDRVAAQIVASLISEQTA